MSLALTKTLFPSELNLTTVFALRVVRIAACLLAAGMFNNAEGWTQIQLGTPVNLFSGVNSSDYEQSPAISADGLTLYFSSDAGTDDATIWQATRPDTSQSFSNKAALPSPINRTGWDGDPNLSADAQTLYFADSPWFSVFTPRPGGFGSGDIWMSRKLSGGTGWTEPENAGEGVNSPQMDTEPDISADGLTLFFTSNRPGGFGGFDSWYSTRPSLDAPWQEAQNAGETINSSSTDLGPCLSDDGQTLFFASNRDNDIAIYAAFRDSSNAAFGEPLKIFSVAESTGFQDVGTPEISADGSILYFLATNASQGLGNTDLWQSPIIRTASVADWATFQ